MHESIARAVYKGYARKLQNRSFDVDKHQPAATRAAWLRSLIKSEERDARSVLLEPPRIVGQGRGSTPHSTCWASDMPMTRNSRT
ncbi:MAG: hypothetical protein MZV64_10290 [Ignavibacteriales bacterium]|nr:hypothetical protein [Ignavibacteriales bacterium]